MTDTSRTRSEMDASSYAPSRTDEVTGWAGWVVFAGMMLILLGSFQAIRAWSRSSTPATTWSRRKASW